MEILNNIWNMIGTENEMLTKIVTAPTVFIEAWLAFLLIASILQFDYTTRKKSVYIGFLSITSLITEFFIPIPYNVIFNYLIMVLFIKILLKLNIIKTILAVIIPTVVFALVGNLILNPFLNIFNISYEQTASIPIYRIAYLAILYLIVYIITLLLHKRNISLNILSDLDKNSRILILTNLVLGIFTIVIQLIVTFYYINTYSLIFTLLNFISLFAYFFISFYSLTRIMKLQVTTKNLENAESYNNTLSILYDNVKAFKHDFDNMIFTIGGFINTNDIDGLKKYYKSLEKDCQRVNNIALLNPKLINNSGIYNLLTAKHQKAKNCNVEIQLEFFFDLNKLHMPIYDFSRMLGILIDNAIEAASTTDEKLVKIIFRDSSQSNIQIVKIENSYSNKDVDKNKIFEKGITEKENHSGMGLWEVKQIIKRNNNINLITESDENYFTQILEIYY